MASHNAPASIAPVTPTPAPSSRSGTRHQLTRSTSEFTSPDRLARGKDHARQLSHHRHPHFPLHRKDFSRDERVTQSAFPTVDRNSLDLSHFDGAGHSRRGSQFVIKPEEITSAPPNPPDTRAIEEEMAREQERASFRVEYAFFA
jgi:hypothetical protein